ncbi:MAG: threonylcarbamoyl-AMP synthase [Candidatus Omnitrophica bacterium]|nr:threonylcarbamoyl-AMP synthase [Candidatus Omnitrophota bacterium]
MKKITVDSRKIKKSSIRKAAKMIAKGKIVAIPTETVYGLAARADRDETVRRLYALKERPKEKPFSVALADPNIAVNQYFLTLPPFGYRLIENFWPGPLTIVYYQKSEGKIGVRIPSHSIANSILQQLDFAVFLPSANRSGQDETISAAEVEEVFGDDIDLIVDGGRTDDKKSSTVIDLTYKPFKILREGLVTEKQIASIFIKRRILFVCTGNCCRSPMAEYLLKSYLQKEKPALSQRYEIISAGIAAPEGKHPPGPLQEIMKKQEGIDISRSEATKLTKQMVLSSDYIFTMENSQRARIVKQVPAAAPRVFNLNKFLPPSAESTIPDPIGKSFIFYENVYNVVKRAIVELVDWL